MNAEILAVGTEILMGQIVNTNARFLSEELAALGISVHYQTVVGDNPDRLREAVRIAVARADILIFTGGLGPTEDDLTKEVVCEFLGVPLVFHPESYEKMQAYLLGRPFVKSNKKQCDLPEGGEVIPNHNGTAPGAILEKDGHIFAFLPGPPKEMEPMFTESVAPFLQKKSGAVIFSRVLRIFGEGESSVESKLHALTHCANPSVATYAKEGEVTVRITAKASDTGEAERMVAKAADEIYTIFGDLVYGEGEENSLPKVVGELLLQKGKCVATAESCTGGLIAKMLTDLPGISEVYKEGYVTYANEVKTKNLGVSPETLQAVGAVSEETAREMAEGLLKRSGADFAVATTGIAGPGGGTAEKPVGLVFIALATQEKTIVKKRNLFGDRSRIRRRAALHVFDLLRRELKNENLE